LQRQQFPVHATSKEGIGRAQSRTLRGGDCARTYE